ncbi:MAG: undecaprenyl-diphosphatase [Thermomicrobiales bacterium]|nr:undecaprenyl-diphosphatase [Thermomicrobiales bacterium]
MDVSVLHALNGLAGHGVWPDRLLGGIATYLPMVMALVLVVTWFWPASVPIRAERQRLVAYAVPAALLGLGVAQIIGHLWFRDRPYIHHTAHLIVTKSADPSFPSDHAVGGFGLAMPFVFARRRLGWVLLALAATLACARVAVGTHYPSDVVGGAILGTAAAYLVWRLRWLIERPLALSLIYARRLRLA